MLKFIEKYRAEKLRSVNQINQALYSETWGQPYRVMHGDKRGRYYVINYWQQDEFGQPIMTPNQSISSACSDIYRLIRQDICLKSLTKINFKAKQETIDKFPKKYHKLVDRLLSELYEFDLHFDINCKLLLPSEVAKDYFYKGSESWNQVFAYLIYHNAAMAEEINHETSSIAKFVNNLFHTEKECDWATALHLKED